MSLVGGKFLENCINRMGANILPSQENLIFKIYAHPGRHLKLLGITRYNLKNLNTNEKEFLCEMSITIEIDNNWHTMIGGTGKRHPLPRFAKIKLEYSAPSAHVELKYPKYCRLLEETWRLSSNRCASIERKTMKTNETSV